MFKILILGAGSVGTYFGAKLFAVNHDVQLYGRRKLQALGNTIEINRQSYPLPPRVNHLKLNFYHLILVTTKLQDTPQILQTIQSLRLQAQIIGFIQNGIVDADFYGELFHHPGFITLSLFNGYRLQNQQLTVLESHLGVQVEASPLGEKLCNLLNEVGIFCQVTPQIERMRAEKLILNTALNALSGLEQKPMGALVDNPLLRPALDGLIRESWAVLQNDYALPSPETLATEIYQTARQVPHHYSSLYQDLMSGRPTEIEFLNGFIVKRGQQQGIATPYNERIYHRILALQAFKQASGQLSKPAFKQQETAA
ncbi:MAG: ketopantoate reductase family protein [Cyanobacteria bacterium P01_D01_bin.44]